MEGKNQINKIQTNGSIKPPTGQEGKQKEKNSKGKAKKAALITAAVTCGLAATVAAAYTYLSLQYRDVFFPNTVINGLDASHKSVEQVKQMIDDGLKAYTLTLEERGGVEEQIVGDEFDLHSEYDGSLERLLASQEPLRWGLHYL